MPIYEFLCPKCNKTSEHLCKMNETGDELLCPNCKSQGLIKKFSSFASPSMKGDQAIPSCKTNSCCPSCIFDK
ncbi:putative regulatory protein, FmdB family [Anaerobranca californiensis DSM 14826]|jgi:putative FmdB family regulatory protein|uniref:Putative regulatory protein, FmdB family n=1 Tax=Anaerobranca californiensis DSM 14826 TaxID=1120989 RepID=A0A1M6NV54_9FIRM|nr:FmdB family zinc ribbon protein [Anaerobranca californiensis]SHJ99550.1 putative regulatory protein, FmdB family [Anaerobranca californiensis DSM 14826]